MTKRFCGMESYPLSFPLVHPTTVLVDDVFERKIGKIVLIPLVFRMRRAFKGMVVSLIRFFLRIPKNESVRSHIAMKKR